MGLATFGVKREGGDHEFCHHDGIIIVNRLSEIATDHWRKLCQAWRSKLTKGQKPVNEIQHAQHSQAVPYLEITVPSRSVLSQIAQAQVVGTGC